MTAFMQMKLHLSRHMYKRGQFKGDAPLENRRKSHIRVRDMGDRMVVQMYSTNIFTAWEDGTFKINCGGWESSPTTREAIHHALRNFAKVFIRIGTRLTMGLRPICAFTPDGVYKYYDNMKFNAEGKLLTLPEAFEQRRVCRSETEELKADLAESQFTALYPMLYATCESDGSTLMMNEKQMRRILCDENQSYRWAEIVATFKFRRGWVYGTKQFETVEISDSKDCWSRMMKHMKKDMYETVRTDIVKF
jgi:hypothetical protein